MEAKWLVITAVAPLAWGANYVVTRQLLPADLPLWGAGLRALPAGLLLLALARRRPTGSWWWRSAVLGTLNVGAFFVLVYLAAQLLPSSVAASVMALAPLTLAGFGWLLAGERPTPRLAVGALAGILGVLVLLGGATTHVSAGGVLASTGALLMSSLGAVLGKRWGDDTPLLATTAWQLVLGGAVLTLVAALAEGAPPSLTPSTAAGFAYTTLVATALAFWCWFAGLARLRAGTVGVIGLLNPVTGVVVGALAASERLTAAQLVGLAVALAGILMVGRSRPTARAAGGVRRTARPAPAVVRR